MKKLLCLLAACMLILGCAAAEERFDGQVIAGNAVSMTAPFGGTVKTIGLREGAMVQAGSVIATVETNRVLATEDGTIRGVFASVGDLAQGTVMYLAPVSKYVISASIAKAYDTADAKYVTLGETVYIRCTKDGSHKAQGIITAVRGSSYTVQTTAGELYMEETVNIYRSEDYAASRCIGTGSVSRTEALAVSGTGSIIKMYVQDGDEVERGQLLFETVEGAMGETPATDNIIRATATGVIAQVKVQAGQKIAKNDVLLTVYQPEDYQISMSIPEDMLYTVTAGKDVTIFFNWNEDKSVSFPGKVEAVSYMSETGGEEGDETTYTAYVSFTADETVRLGMNVTVVMD